MLCNFLCQLHTLHLLLWLICQSFVYALQLSSHHKSWYLYISFYSLDWFWQSSKWYSLTFLWMVPGPRLMTDTQHSTLCVFEWGILSMDCESFHTQDLPIQIHGAESGVLSVECWVIVNSLEPGPKSMMDTQHSTLRIHTPHSGSPIQLHVHWVYMWSAEYPW